MGELIFEKYEIRSRLAVGGMGEVFYAVQTQRGVRGFERPVILKSLLPDLAQQEGFIDQFLDEARVAATLNHPNVVSIYEVGLWNGVYFIAMEFISGRNIAQLMKASIKQKLPVPPTVIARVVHDAAMGLDHAHNATDASGSPLNIVHRDISPQNIMVRQDGVTKVVDFGIARASNRSTRTATGAVKGKLAYMAPEQLMSKPLNGQTDQFALGIVLWEMCAGRRLFTAERDLDLIKKVLEEEIPHPSTLVPGFPEELGDIALKMAARDPEKRFATLADAGKELSSFLMKFSPPSSESPVKGFMKLLGTEDIKTANRATPSNANFVIALGKGVTPSSPGAPLDLSDEDVPLGSIVMTTPEPIKAVIRKSKRRSALIGVAASVLLVGLGATAYLVAKPPPPPPKVVVEPTTPSEPVAPVVPVDPPKPAVAAPGKLALSTSPSGAQIRFDGRPFVTPVVLEGAAGAHVFLIEKPGFRRVEFELNFEPGVQLKKEVKLERLTAAPPRPEVAAPPPAGLGLLTLSTVPEASIYINGAFIERTPFFRKSVPSGRQTLTLVYGDGNKTTRVVDIVPGKELKVSFDLK